METGERVYHTPDSPWYGRTDIDTDAGERWFCSEQEALDAGWRAPRSSQTSSTATPVKGNSAGNCRVLVNVNTAGSSELENLPGIGEVLAQRIVDYRAANGEFGNADELEEVKGIGPATLAKIRHCIVLR